MPQLLQSHSYKMIDTFCGDSRGGGTASIIKDSLKKNPLNIISD